MNVSTPFLGCVWGWIVYGRRTVVIVAAAVCVESTGAGVTVAVAGLSP